jgi:hypothetical protein
VKSVPAFTLLKNEIDRGVERPPAQTIVPENPGVLLACFS